MLIRPKHELIRRLKSRNVFHFTDTRNLPFIKQHGLLSRAELARRGIKPPAPGGDDSSAARDKKIGLDDHVHLCFTIGHPMVKRCIERGSIKVVRWLSIHPQILLSAGVRYCMTVSTATGATVIKTREAIDQIDWHVLTERTNWKDSAIQKRLQLVDKYEILIPTAVAAKYIIW